jgi:hypothetical protein
MSAGKSDQSASVNTSSFHTDSAVESFLGGAVAAEQRIAIQTQHLRVFLVCRVQEVENYYP